MVLTPSSKINANANQSPILGKPPRGAANNKQRVSFSPTHSPRNGGRRRRSSSHFTKKGKGGNKSLVNSDVESDDDESDIEFTLNGVNDIDSGGDKHTIGGTNNTTPTKKKKKPDKLQRRRRRSSARFLRLSSGGDDDANTNNENGGSPNGINGDDENYTSSEHLGEIYRQAIRMNAENKINAGNSWGLKLIENMDKFIVDDKGTNNGDNGGDISPRENNADNARSELKAARKMKSKDDKGRVNFTKASCTLDASVKIYSYRVDDVHLSSYRVLANLNRTDTKGNNNDDGLEDGGVDLDGEGGNEKTVSKRRVGPRGPTETLESNKGTYICLVLCMCSCGYILCQLSSNCYSLSFFYPTTTHTANINMSKLDSAYDIDPLFHKMSKSFDEGGAKGLLLGNLGVSQHGCNIVFDSKADDEDGGATKMKLDKINEEDEEEKADEEAGEEDNEFNIDPEDAKVWNEGEIDITNLASKLQSMIASYGHRTSNSVPFVPQLESLRQDYAKLEEEGYAVDENAGKEGRKRLKLYDAP